MRTVVGQCCFQRSVLGFDVPGDALCMPRARRTRRVEVRLASTGALVSTQRIAGPEPNVCTDWVGRRPTASQFEAGDPEPEAYAPFLTAAVLGTPLPPEVVVLPSDAPAAAGGGAPVDLAPAKAP